MHYREMTSEDLPVVFDVRIRTWHNPNGEEELERMGVTQESVREMLLSTHLGWEDWKMEGGDRFMRKKSERIGAGLQVVR